MDAFGLAMESRFARRTLYGWDLSVVAYGRSGFAKRLESDTRFAGGFAAGSRAATPRAGASARSNGATGFHTASAAAIRTIEAASVACAPNCQSGPGQWGWAI